MTAEDTKQNPILDLEAMKVIAEAFSKLDDTAVRRVLRWANEAYGSKLSIAAKLVDKGDTITGDTSVDFKTQFASLAEFFASATPTQDADKALVVGYWIQVIEGTTDLDGFRVNKELKQLGHGVKNVTSALNTLMARKPALVIQTKKSGTSRQAKKKYKLTHEGQRSVERMINQDQS